jgi:hypothetical protein
MASNLKDLFKTFSNIPANRALRKKQVSRLLLKHAEEKPLADPEFTGWVLELADKLFNQPNQPQIESVSSLV